MKHFFTIKIILLVMVYCQVPYSLLAKEKIGVIDFTESEGLPSGTGKTAASHAIVGLLDSRKYIVIERSTIEFILKEQALQNKGCTDTECAVKTGKLIAANLMLTGNIIDLAGKLIVSVNVRNIELGKVEFSETISITKLTELESTIADSVKRFIFKKKKETIAIPSSPTLTREQEQAFAFSYVFPGSGHLMDGQGWKGMIFLTGYFYSAYNLLAIVPNANKVSRKDIIFGYQGAIASLSTIDTLTPAGAQTASAMFGFLHQDELRRQGIMHTKTLNSAYLVLAIWTIIHTDLHITVLDNHIFKSFRYIYMNLFPENSLNRNAYLENRNSSPRYEIAFRWSF